MLTNDYFLAFNSKIVEKVEDPRIPSGYAVCIYRERYIPIMIMPAHDPSNGTFSCSAGTNPETMGVPISFIKSANGLVRAIGFVRSINQKIINRERQNT